MLLVLLVLWQCAPAAVVPWYHARVVVQLVGIFFGEIDKIARFEHAHLIHVHLHNQLQGTKHIHGHNNVFLFLFVCYVTRAQT